MTLNHPDGRYQPELLKTQTPHSSASGVPQIRRPTRWSKRWLVKLSVGTEGALRDEAARSEEEALSSGKALSSTSAFDIWPRGRARRKASGGPRARAMATVEINSKALADLERLFDFIAV